MVDTARNSVRSKQPVHALVPGILYDSHCVDACVKEKVTETSNAEKKKTHTRRGGLGVPVEATKSARAQTNAAAKMSKPWSTPHGPVYDPNNACMVKCREVVHDVTVYDDDTVCLTCMVRIRRQLDRI